MAKRQKLAALCRLEAEKVREASRKRTSFIPIEESAYQFIVLMIEARTKASCNNYSHELYRNAGNDAPREFESTSEPELAMGKTLATALTSRLEKDGFKVEVVTSQLEIYDKHNALCDRLNDFGQSLAGLLVDAEARTFYHEHDEVLTLEISW